MITVERLTLHAHGKTARAWWLSNNGVPVGYLKTLDNHYQGYPVVCDVEVREGHRGKGYAGMLLRHAAKTHGVDKLMFSGSFTPEGYTAFAEKSWCEDKPRSSFNSMTFVDNWDAKVPKWDRDILDESTVWELPEAGTCGAPRKRDGLPCQRRGNCPNHR